MSAYELMSAYEFMSAYELMSACGLLWKQLIFCKFKTSKLK